MNSVQGRPYKTPNRWMINHVPVMPEKRRVDWLSVIGFAVVIASAVWFAMAMRTI